MYHVKNLIINERRNEVYEGWNLYAILGEAGKAGKGSPISLKIVQKGWKTITDFPYFWLVFIFECSGNPAQSVIKSLLFITLCKGGPLQSVKKVNLIFKPNGTLQLSKV